MADKEAHWYVAHTYSGYEKKVKANIEMAIENRNMQDLVLEIIFDIVSAAHQTNISMYLRKVAKPAAS